MASVEEVREGIAGGLLLEGLHEHGELLGLIEEAEVRSHLLAMVAGELDEDEEREDHCGNASVEDGLLDPLGGRGGCSLTGHEESLLLGTHRVEHRARRLGELRASLLGRSRLLTICGEKEIEGGELEAFADDGDAGGERRLEVVEANPLGEVVAC